MTHKLFKLSNNHISIQVKSLGAELCSLRKDDLEYLWQADEKYWGRHALFYFQ